MARDTEFGKRMRQMRRRLALTQQELGARLGITKVSVARYEAGRVPRLDLLREISRVGGVSVAWLLHNEAASRRDRAIQSTPVKINSRMWRLISDLTEELELRAPQLSASDRRHYERRASEVISKAVRELREYRALLEGRHRQ